VTAYNAEVRPSPILPRNPRSRYLPFAVQGVLILASGTLAFTPPAHGLMLVVPLLPGIGASVDHVVAAAGGQIAGIGPFPGSRYAQADRSALLPAALRSGMILLNGRPRFCGPLSGNP
jgi:hypothetical protein